MAPTVEDVALPLAGRCTTVPAAADGVCDVCHGSPNPGFSTCYSCAQGQSQVSEPCSLVVPVSLYSIPSQLHHELRNYKDASDPELAAGFRWNVDAILGYFLLRHRGCIAEAAGGDWSVIANVPSTAGRAGEHPLATAIKMVPGLDEEYEDLLIPGTVAISHNRASDDGFAVRRVLHGERVLVVDDTFTTGARAQSAASAISRAGGHTVAIVPIGRVFDPTYNNRTKSYWATQRAVRFDFERCCLES